MTLPSLGREWLQRLRRRFHDHIYWWENDVGRVCDCGDVVTPKWLAAWLKENPEPPNGSVLRIPRLK